VGRQTDTEIEDENWEEDEKEDCVRKKERK